MKSLKKMNHLYHVTFLKLKNHLIFFIYHIVKRMKPNLRTSLESLMSLPTGILESLLVGKQEKLVLFSLKNKNLYRSCKIYYGKCKQCGEDYVGETKRNYITHWREHDNPTHKSETARHRKNHVERGFESSILCNAPIKEHLRKILKRNS